jgi:hypothetical protein
MVTFSEYLFFVFLASVGVLQLVALRARLKGLLFFKQPVLTYIFSILATGGAYWWFFQRDNRIDTIMRQTGLEGKQQFFSFCTAAFLAVVFTLVVSSLIGMLGKKPQKQDDDDVDGLDALKEKTYFEAIKHSFRSKKD